MPCEFILQLSKLRKSAAESVENTDGFDIFKQYLHVERQVEKELRKLIKEVNSKQNKCLILLCGSAGDGKSHLISYLKNYDRENLLADYQPYNDATESSKPTLTSIDTLAEKLVSFNDDNYDNDDGTKMIIAINLGTLNNFIESEKGLKFSKLKQYVQQHDILSSYAKNIGYINNSKFQHVSFADYQVFSLNSKGIVTSYLESLINKVFNNDDENPFYAEYKKDITCSVSNRCPVRHNFELLSNPVIQKAIVNRIVQAVIMDKTIVSTRDVLNLLFDLIVHPEFNQSEISFGVHETQFLQKYLSWTTPMLLNEYDDISPLINSIRKHDTLKLRSEERDEDVTRFYSLDNIEQIYKTKTNSTPYYILSGISNISELGAKKPELKKLVYKFIARLDELQNPSIDNIQKQRFNEYLKYLYYQNSGNERNLSQLYDSTKKAALNWDGEFGQDEICIDDTNEKYWILENLSLRAYLDRSIPQTNDEIQRFSPVLTLRYRKDPQGDTSPITIRIDFALFELIENMRDGYRPTIQDKNRHTDFVSFVQQLKEFGNKSRRILILSKENENSCKMMFEETDFGYEFKVVR